MYSEQIMDSSQVVRTDLFCIFITVFYFLKHFTCVFTLCSVFNMLKEWGFMGDDSECGTSREPLRKNRNAVHVICLLKLYCGYLSIQGISRLIVSEA